MAFLKSYRIVLFLLFLFTFIIAAQSPGKTYAVECGRDGCCSVKIPGGKCQYTDRGIPCPGGYVSTSTWYCPLGDNYRCCRPAAQPPPTTGSTKISLDLLMHGIGKAGDSQNPGEPGGGNGSPDNEQRTITVNVFNLSGQNVAADKTGTVVFSSASGSFKTQSGGEINLGSLASGSYIIKVKMPQSLTKAINKNITTNTINNVAVTSLITGDVNGDNKVDFTDYGIVKDCVSEFQAPANCTAENKAKADLDDDGEVKLGDLNLFLRELSNGVGD